MKLAAEKESYHGLLSEVSAPRQITYQGKVYRAGYSAFSSRLALVEYFLPGEAPAQWTEMMALRVIPRGVTPKGQCVLMKEMAEAKGGRGFSHERPGGEAGVEFMLPEARGGFEFNVFRYAYQRDGVTVKSVQYARKLRETAALENTDTNLRVKEMKAIGMAPLPDLRVQGW